MNKTLIGLLSAAILLNTACSPKQEDTSGSSIQSSSAITTAASSEASVATSLEAEITPAETPSPPNGGLLNTYWKLILLNDTEVAGRDSQREPNIFLSAENRITGSDGCNRMSGTYTLDGEKLTFGPMAGTRMACADVGEQAQTFNEALTKVASYTVHSDQLELRDASGLVIARFKSATAP
jgi:heat shock protein HslJ